MTLAVVEFNPTKYPLLFANGLYRSKEAWEWEDRVYKRRRPESTDSVSKHFVVEEEVKRATAFINEVGIIKTFPHKFKLNSYSVKHVAEAWGREVKKLSNAYISNGSFIYACLECSVPIRLIDAGPNVYVALSRKGVDDAAKRSW